MLKLETALYTVIWDDFLGQVNKTSEGLQNPRMDLNTTAKMLTSLKGYIEGKRKKFEKYEEQAVKLTEEKTYEGENKRQRKINVRLAQLDSPQAPEAELTPSAKFRTQEFSSCGG